MLKVEEIRVGNFIRMGNDIINVTPERISAVAQFPKDYAPLPISYSRLVNNGWEPYDEDYSIDRQTITYLLRHDRYGRIRIFASRYGGVSSSADVYLCDKCDDNYSVVESIHELQNIILACYGEEWLTGVHL